jgi:GNAT superfamily N-acetyltransferase
MDDAYAIRTMRHGDIDLAIQWAEREGWNPGLNDAQCFHAADPDGFLLGLLGETPVAAISAVRYGQDFGFVGFYIVAPEHRGQGFGLRIWSAAMQRLRGRTVGLDGVPDQQTNYQKSGFRLACRNVRHQGFGGEKRPEHVRLKDLSQLPFDAIAAYDRRFFPAERTRFLLEWLNQPGGAALGLLEDGRLAGYGVLRPCRSGYKIGPLFADHAEAAEDLFCALASEVPAEAPVFLDTPEANPAAMDLARRHGMAPVFETARMYAGDAPALELHGIFGVTSFELG